MIWITYILSKWYRVYIVEGEMNVSDIGEENLVVELMLNNFISEHAVA